MSEQTTTNTASEASTARYSYPWLRALLQH